MIQLVVEQGMHMKVRSFVQEIVVFAFGIELMYVLKFHGFSMEGDAQIK